jgi:hypothetical protein
VPIDPDIEPVLAALEQRLQAQLDAQRVRQDELSRHISATGDMLNAHHAELVAIKRRLDALEQTTPPPPDPTGGTWFGYTWSGLGTSLNQKPGIVREFNGTRNPDTAQIARTLGRGVPLWYSWKPDLLTTSWRTGVEAAIRAAVTPESPALFITVWHEPEGSGDAGGGDPVTRSKRWRDAQSFLHQIALKLRDEGRGVWVAPIICDWTFWDRGQGSPEEHWYPKSWQDYDLMGFDVYPRGQKADGKAMIARLTTTGPNQVAPYDHNLRTDTRKAVRLCAQWALECGKPWGSAETGVIDGSVSGADVQYPYTRAQRAQRFREIAADITKQLPAEGLPAPLLWAWYSDGGCSLFNAGSTDTASVTAWNDSIATNPTIADLKAAL